MKKVKIIENCPICDTKLERVIDQLFCQNLNCSATLEKKIIHFSKAMKIKGLGEKTIDKLKLISIDDIYRLSKEGLINILGEKLGEKLFKEIEYSKLTSLEKILPALSISLIGNTAARKLNLVVSNINDITYNLCKQAGLGDKASKNLCDWLETDKHVYQNLPLTYTSIKQPTEISNTNYKVCITGKLDDFKSRELASIFLREKGINVVSGVSKTLDFLINEDNKPSSKLSKANSYNIPVITIKQLIEENIND